MKTTSLARNEMDRQAGPAKVARVLFGQFPTETTGPRISPKTAAWRTADRDSPVAESSLQRPYAAVAEALRIFGRQQRA